jgi:hypothetical protein
MENVILGSVISNMTRIINNNRYLSMAININLHVNCMQIKCHVLTENLIKIDVDVLIINSSNKFNTIYNNNNL